MSASFVPTFLALLPQASAPAVPPIKIERWAFSFENCVASVGDVSGDGISDVLVGDDYGSEQTESGTRHGLAWLLSGADATVIHTLEKMRGDLDADGRADILTCTCP